jgi:hypothetical protein
LLFNYARRHSNTNPSYLRVSRTHEAVAIFEGYEAKSLKVPTAKINKSRKCEQKHILANFHSFLTTTVYGTNHTGFLILLRNSLLSIKSLFMYM